MCKGYFINFLGEEFSKIFDNVDELLEFAEEQKELGTEFIGMTGGYIND